MRHLRAHYKLNRTSAHRTAMQRNLAQSLFEHGQITTTLPKAKDLKPIAERLITLARRAHGGDLGARRNIYKILGDRSFIPAEHMEKYLEMTDAQRQRVRRARSGRRHRTGTARAGMAFTAESVIHRLITTHAPRYLNRPGGYTRLIRLPKRRVGDQSPLAVLQLVGDEVSPGSVTKPAKSSRRKKADARYAAVVKAAKAAVQAKRTAKGADATSGAEGAPDQGT